MFVDIGLDKNAFLHYWDAIPAALDPGVEAIERQGGKRKNQKRITANDIPKIYPPGSDIIVQVTKGPIGTKGPRITTNISLAGPLSRPHALLRPVRHLAQDRGPQGTPAPAPHPDRARPARRHGRDHPHRGRRPEGALLRARPPRAARTMAAASPATWRRPARPSCSWPSRT